MVKSSVILLVLSFSALSTALICEYQNEPFGYTCHITNQTYTDAFEVITLEGTHLEGMDDEKVLVVRFSDSTIHFVPNRIFFKFVNITNLFMENVGLTRLNVNSFNNANKLKNIFMNNNQITQIHPYSLKRCPELNTIFLSNNLITSIEAQQFAHNSKIHTIVLSNNLIRGINPSFLWNIIGFTYIDLTGNRCIDQHIFAQNGMLGSSAENLRECYDCQCDLFQHLICVFSSTSCTVQRATLNSENLWFSGKYDTDLRDYNVRSIRFADETIVPYLSNEVFQTFNNIRSLVITNVGLKTINRTSFMGADLLAEIHLGQNLLTSIPEDTFHDLQHLQFLELSQNRFETIEKKLFAENPELTQVYLSNNRVLKNIHPETFAANPKLLVRN